MYQQSVKVLLLFIFTINRLLIYYKFGCKIHIIMFLFCVS